MKAHRKHRLKKNQKCIAKRLGGKKNPKNAVREILFENKKINLNDDASQMLEWSVQMGYGIFTLGGTENSAV